MSTFALTLIHSLAFAILSYVGYFVLTGATGADHQQYFQFFLLTISIFPFADALINFLRDRNLRNANYVAAVGTLIGLVALLYFVCYEASAAHLGGR